MNNLKQIGLAMYNYAAAHGHFPSQTVLGPDGKTPHSWRVAILPYLEQQALYDQYRFDEPWDSAHNKQILKNMPVVYRHPSDDRDGNAPSYFVFTGPETIFDGASGTNFAAITDGTSNTILNALNSHGIHVLRSLQCERPLQVELELATVYVKPARNRQA